MSSMPRPSAATARLPLIGHRAGSDVVAWRGGEPVAASRFLAEVLQLAQALPAASHVLNGCTDRYRFAVLLCAAILRGQVTLLPATTTPNVIEALKRKAPDVYVVTDDPHARYDLPHFDWPVGRVRIPESFEVPAVDADQVVAHVFTSGSTGEPRPHAKTWSSLVRDVRGEAERFGIGAGHAILGTVPPQHMYGFESTVMLPLASGAAFTAERLYYPADIDAGIAARQAPRVLFTTPFHLRTWLESGPPAAVEMIVSATAPLSVPLAREAELRTGAVLHEIYGCTEAGQVASRRPTLSPEWQALPGLRVWNDGTQAICQGAHVDEATPLQDLIEPLGDGSRFLLHGRTADLVNIAGKRNSLGYLNHQLTAIPGVLDGAFFLPDEIERDGVTRLMAFVVAPGLDAATVLAGLRRAIDAAFMPRPLVFVERLPRQLTGKLPREALAALAARLRPRPR
jgi:acyl-coenzyme A synthetase/AMP-(fatty) acid ligase